MALKKPIKKPQVFKSEYQGIPVPPEPDDFGPSIVERVLPEVAAAVATMQMVEHLRANPPEVGTEKLQEYFEGRSIEGTTEEPGEWQTEAVDSLQRTLDRFTLTRPPNWGYGGRANCIAFTAVLDKEGKPIEGPNGPVYHAQQVPPKKGFLYCTECHDYTKFKGLGDSRMCTQCGISDNDYYVKTANGLWPSTSKK